MSATNGVTLKRLSETFCNVESAKEKTLEADANNLPRHREEGESISQAKQTSKHYSNCA